jgi:hypothetical protein
MFDKNSNNSNKVSNPIDIESNDNTDKTQTDIDEKIDMEIYVRDTRSLILSDDAMNEIINKSKPSDTLDIRNIFGESFDIVSLLMYLGLRYDALNSDNDS